LQDASNTGVTKEVFDMIELTDAELEQVSGGAISSKTEVIKVPGPNDTVVTTATNPAMHTVPGQSSITTLSNREARQLAT
jgi:bacteriocin-like protein